MSDKATLRIHVSALLPVRRCLWILQVRELRRRVHVDACIEFDTNRYGVRWKLIGETMAERQVRGQYAGQKVVVHAQHAGRRVNVSPRTGAGAVGVRRGATSFGVGRLPAQ